MHPGRQASQRLSMLKSLSKTDSVPILRIDDFIDRISQVWFVSKFDLLSGYYYIPLNELAEKPSAFITPATSKSIKLCHLG